MCGSGAFRPEAPNLGLLVGASPYTALHNLKYFFVVRVAFSHRIPISEVRTIMPAAAFAIQVAYAGAELRVKACPKVDPMGAEREG